MTAPQQQAANDAHCRREPMPFEPAWYAEAKSREQLTWPEDSDFGALEGLANGVGYIAAAWGVIGVLVFLAWLAWWPL